MQTALTYSPLEAAEFIKRGRLVAFPTETVYGLGANIFDAGAIAGIFAAKRRPADNPLIAHVGSREQIGMLTTEMTGSAKRFIDSFFPGPLTIVLKKTAAVPDIATAGLDTIGIRMPRLEVSRAFLVSCDTVLAAPSANLSGRPSPTTWEAVYEDLNGRIDCILQGPECEIGLESTIVDCTSDTPRVLRVGSISLDRLRAVVPETAIFDFENAYAPKSPGLHHRHYSPRANVVLLDPASEDLAIRIDPVADRTAFIGITRPAAAFETSLICTSVEDYAHSLFEYFRECDRKGIDTILCETVTEAGIGAAVMDRLRRSADH